MIEVFEASAVEDSSAKMLDHDHISTCLRWMFADAMHQSPLCMPECKAALADLWTYSIDCLNKMRVVVQQRDPETAGVPLSTAVPHYIDAVGKGNRTD
eukprot:11010814-Alexandrium_andersonii.AAC.1